MTYEIMPGRVFCYKENTYEYDGGFSEHEPDDDSLIVAQYVRADLANGDPNEPLKENQFRWVSVGGERHVARLEWMLNDYDELELFFCTTDSCTWQKEELDFIGPVIRPLEDV